MKIPVYCKHSPFHMDSTPTVTPRQKLPLRSRLKFLFSTKMSNSIVLFCVIAIGIGTGVLVSFFVSPVSDKPLNKKDTIEGSYVIPTLSYFDLKALDNEPLEYSRSMELSGEVGSGVVAIEIWSSCDDDIHRLKSFKKNNVAFTYKIANNLGNLCRGNNEYSVRAIGKDGAKEKQISAVSRFQMSQVGLRKRTDLPLVKFLEEHMLPSTRSIEDIAILPSRLFPSPQFQEACNKKGLLAAEEDVMMPVGNLIGAKLSIEKEQQYVGSSATIRIPYIHFFAKKGNVYSALPIPPLSLNTCDQIPGIHVIATSDSRLLVDDLSGGSERYFDGSTWTNIRTFLLRSVPIENNDLGQVRAIIKDNILSIIEENEYGERYYEEPKLMGNVRGEYLFSMDTNSFQGVVWHKKR